MLSKPTFNDRKRRSVGVELVPLVLAVVAVTALVAARSWLKSTSGGPMLSLVALAVVILVIGSSWYFSIRWDRRQDEVQKASTQFAVRWGTSAGTAAFGLLMMVP